MTEAEAVEAISARWKTAWEASQPTIPYALHNEAFRSQDLAAFAVVTFTTAVPKQLTQGPIGARLFQYRGTCHVKLFGPLDVGAKQLAELAGHVRAALASQSIGGGPATIPVQTFSAGSVPGKEGRWSTLLLPIPYEWHERA